MFFLQRSWFVRFGRFAAEIVPLKSRIRRSSACMSLDHLQPPFGVFGVRGIKLLCRCLLKVFQHSVEIIKLKPSQAKVFVWSYFARLPILRSFCVSAGKVHDHSLLYFVVQDPFTLNVYLDPQTGSAKGREVLIPLDVFPRLSS